MSNVFIQLQEQYLMPRTRRIRLDIFIILQRSLSALFHPVINDEGSDNSDVIHFPTREINSILSRFTLEGRLFLLTELTVECVL